MYWRILFLLLAAVVQQFGQSSTDAGHEATRALQAGDYATARQIIQAALKQSPNDARLWTLRGLTLVRLGSPSAALASFNRALEISPTYYPALEGAVQLELRSQAPHAAVTLQRILAIHPDDATALRELASLFMKQKRPEDALPLLRRLAELQPSSDDAALDLAAVEFILGHYPNVISTLTPLVSRQTSDVQALELLAESYNASSDPGQALGVLEAAIAASPQSVQLYVEFANICLSRGLFQKGIDTLNSGLLRLPTSARLYVARGVLYSELAEYEKGEADFKNAERLDPNVEGGSVAKGLAELQRNDLSAAEATVRARLQEQPRQAFLHYLLAEVLTRKGAAPGTPEFKEALQSARTAVDLKPDFALARDLLGRLDVEDGNLEEGIRQSRIALNLNPSDQKALYHLISALRKANQTAELPALLKQLVALRERTGRDDIAERNYQLIETPAGPRTAAQSTYSRQ